MPSFKTRRKHISSGGTQIGAGGSVVSELLFGTATITCPSVAANNLTAAGSVAISGLNAGATVLVSAVNLPAGIVLLGASAAAGTLSASFLNSGSANSASQSVTLLYLAVA